MAHPLLFEVNTRCWLNALSDKLGRPVTLDTAPEEEIVSWKKHGFTHVWLMGAWATGPKTRDTARSRPGLRALSREAFGTGGGEKLASSPYAVEDFTAAAFLGGPAALRRFRARLHRRGLGLVLDFIPNHLGLDHRWLVEKNSLFVGSATRKPETFPAALPGGIRWVAHGKDPYFPAWADTAQLDYRLALTRAAMIRVLQSVAQQCDGARCDTAMLELNDVFDRTWEHFPADSPAPPGEFWSGAIAAVKKCRPRFLFIAEAYWDLEPRLQALGFDYVYDKKFLEYVSRRDYPGLQRHVRAAAGKFQPARFLENHDEARIASLLTTPEQKAAAVLLLAQPGLRLLHDGQLAGKTRRAPPEFACYWPEDSDPEMSAFYDRLLTLLPSTAVGAGDMEFCETGLPHCFAMQWRKDAGRLDWVCVNLAPQRASFEIPAPEPGWKVADIFSDGGSAWSRRGWNFHIDLAACGFQLLESRPPPG